MGRRRGGRSYVSKGGRLFLRQMNLYQFIPVGITGGGFAVHQSSLHRKSIERSKTRKLNNTGHKNIFRFVVFRTSFISLRRAVGKVFQVNRRFLALAPPFGTSSMISGSSSLSMESIMDAGHVGQFRVSIGQIY